MIATLSQRTGVPEPSLRLLLALLAQYPAALGARKLLSQAYTPAQRNLYTLVAGSAIALFFCQKDVLYAVGTTFVTWLLCWLSSLMGLRRLAAPLAFIFNFIYLLAAYATYASEGYDINWTTPQAVLCLRLIGFAFDFSDGAQSSADKRPSSTLATAVAVAKDAMPNVFGDDVKTSFKTANKQENTTTSIHNRSAPVVTTITPSHVPTAWAGNISLDSLPSLLETFAYAFHYSSFLVGPQFSFSLYRRYLTLQLFQAPSKQNTLPSSLSVVLSSSLPRAARTFGLGVLYLLVTQVLQALYPSSLLLTKTHLYQPLLQRIFTVWWCGKTALTKYVGVWLLTEGACVLSCIAMDGFESTSLINNNNNKSNKIPIVRWSGLTNLDAWRYETATSLAQIIANFNINTNHWAKLYLFKRLRFLGNKNLSAVGTLIFLAMWHGFHGGYVYAFSLEFIDMEAERWLGKICGPWLQRNVYSPESSRVIRMVVGVGRWLLTTSALFYAAMGFDLLQWSRIRVAAGSVYWAGHIAVALVIIGSLLLGDKTRTRTSGSSSSQGTSKSNQIKTE